MTKYVKNNNIENIFLLFLCKLKLFLFYLQKLCMKNSSILNRYIRLKTQGEPTIKAQRIHITGITFRNTFRPIWQAVTIPDEHLYNLNILFSISLSTMAATVDVCVTKSGLKHPATPHHFSFHWCYIVVNNMHNNLILSETFWTDHDAAVFLIPCTTCNR